MKRLFKLFLKRIFLGLTACVPRRSFEKIIERFSVAPRMPNRMFSYLERIINYLNRQVLTKELVLNGVWYRPSGGAPNRYEIYSYVFDCCSKGAVDYLEFGVFRGDSIRWVLSKLGPESRVYGFDSFFGLSRDWYYGCPKGTFHMGGSEPSIKAPNVWFIKGWFEESLKPFLQSTVLKNQLVLHMDADLYEPTIYVLRTMKDFFAPGTVVIFDEYWFVKDEFRALKDFIHETKKRFEYLAVTDQRAAIRFTV